MYRSSLGVILILAALAAFSLSAFLDASPNDPPTTTGTEKEEGLSLVIEAAKTAPAEGQAPKVTATLVNKTRKALTLVQPGDGSESGWRTPIVAWSVIRVEEGGTAKHPAEAPLYKGGRCGNVNALTKSEIFTLEPGKSKVVDEWLGAPQFPGPGTYRVVCYYQNDPERKWKGGPLGKHDPEAMEQVKKSFPCALVSNELKIVVAEKKP